MSITRSKAKNMETMETSENQPDVSVKVQVLRIKLKVVQKRLYNMRPDPTLAQAQRNVLEALKEEQHQLINQLIELLPDELDKDIAEDESFQDEYITKMASLQITDVKPSPETTQLVVQQHRLHIPMPTFDGNYEQWPKFKAMFLDIMSRINDSDAVKLHHLNKALTGKAAGIVNASMMNSNNFDSVWDVLIQRFENPRLIVDKHINGLLHLKSVARESAKDLRQLTETCKAHVDGLIYMKQPIDNTSNLFITHILSSRMDTETRKAWEQSLKHGEFPDLYKTLEFLTRQCEVLESCSSGERSSRQPSANPASTKVFVSSNPEPSQLCCAMCKQQHFLQKCPAFLIMTKTERMDKLKTLKRCFNCFGTGHLADKCSSPWSCRHCKARHHTLIHVEKSREAVSNLPPVTAGQSTIATTSLTAASPSTVLLSTVLLNITDNAGVSHPARVLLDSGAQSSFMTGRLAQFLCLPRKLVNIPFTGIGGSTNSIVRHSVVATIHSRCSSYSATVEFLVLPKLTVDMPTRGLNINHWNIPDACVLADPSFNKPAAIDMILGATHFYEFLRTGQLSLGDNMPTLQETVFGWIVSGSTTIKEPSSPITCAVATHTNELDSLMKRFFAIEELSTSPSWSTEERECEEHYTATTTREENGRYVVRLPRKAEMIGKLGDSKNIALRRFLAIERHLQREPEIQRAYVDFMNEYLRLGHMSKVAASSTNTESFYLPHHPVFKADSTTTKCRVVFDASSKSSSGVSLNDTLMVGPTIQQDATSILMRFRTRSVALTADVAKMYRQVLVHPNDRSLQRILWRNSPDEPIEEYELNTVTYGTAAAPFLAVRSLQQTVEDHGKEYPAAAARSCDFYVDDFVSGCDSIEAAETLQKQTADLYAKTGFELRKWASNKPSVLQSVDQQFLAVIPHTNDGSEGLLATLGLVWDSSSDNMKFKINSSHVVGPITKRKVLSCIARIYDPLGIVDPVKAKAKQFLQRIWTLQTDQQHPWGWDDELPQHLQGEWITFHSQLTYLQELHIPRVAIGLNTVSCQFHFFCDASEKGYGACCYIRSCNEQGDVTMQLFASKTKVTPISSKHSIARLELCAAQLASLLYERVKSAVGLQSSATFWTDSTTVVHWLRGSPSCWKPFVANRVSQIQQLTIGCVWRHISGLDNPADLASRGCLSKELLNNPLWWQGPLWMSDPEEQWPKSSISSSPEEVAAERRTTTVACTTVEKSHHHIFTLYSSFSKLRRMMAYWVQYFNRCSRRRTYTGTGITTTDLREAEEVLCRWSQRDYFMQEIHALQRKESVPSSSKLKWLHPQLGADGIIRVGGRLSNSQLSEDAKHPLVVPNGHPLAHLLMDHFHKTLLHAGPQLMLSTSRQRYWILGGRSQARKTYHQCLTCFRARPTSSETLMADLPSTRVTPIRPFSITGIDYCGPVFVKGAHRRAVATKAYVAIFVCFSTRAIHIELVSNLTTEAFISALRRFVARRGLPAELHSDNATNFKGASNQLNEVYRLLHSSQHQRDIRTWTLDKKISWKFIPPRAPHFGGLWEAAVRSMKHHLVRVLGNASLSFEDMATLLTEIECCLNSRPITPMSDDPNDVTALTPGHFLVGSHLQHVPDPETTLIPENRLTHWRYVQQLMRHFWYRWHQEYLQQLQPRSKWLKNEEQTIVPGTLVIIKEDNVPPLYWPLARVVEVHPGKDGKARVFTLQTSSRSRVVRPLVKLCVIPTVERNN